MNAFLASDNKVKLLLLDALLMLDHKDAVEIITTLLEQEKEICIAAFQVETRIQKSFLKT